MFRSVSDHSYTYCTKIKAKRVLRSETAPFRCPDALPRGNELWNGFFAPDTSNSIAWVLNDVWECFGPFEYLLHANRSKTGVWYPNAQFRPPNF